MSETTPPLAYRALDRLNGRILAVLVTVLLLAATFFVFSRDGGEKTVTAHFSRAVAVYEGSEVRLMGVKIGTVDAVVPEGDSVRVEMTYDAAYTLPATAKAAIITPTLVADRFVQLTPPYSDGAVLADGADIPLDRTASPVELDRIYKSLAELGDTLGPHGANRTGALDELISAGANALRGQGKLANETINDLAGAAEVFGDNRGELFSSVRQLSELTGVLAANDRFVNQFMGDLASVSAQLGGEREELQAALAALAGSVGTVRDFVRDNKQLVESEVEELTTVLGALAKQKDALSTALQLAPLGLNNLAAAFDVKTGTIGARVQFGDTCAPGIPCLPTSVTLGNMLCDVVVNSGTEGAPQICQLLKAITSRLTLPGSGSPAQGGPAATAPAEIGTVRPPASLNGLLGGAS